MTRQKDKLYMPMGTGGIMRYAEEEEELLKINPKQLVALVTAIVFVEIILKFIFV